MGAVALEDNGNYEVFNGEDDCSMGSFSFLYRKRMTVGMPSYVSGAFGLRRLRSRGEDEQSM